MRREKRTFIKGHGKTKRFLQFKGANDLGHQKKEHKIQTISPRILLSIPGSEVQKPGRKHDIKDKMYNKFRSSSIEITF